MWSELCYSFVPSVDSLLSHLGRDLVHDHTLVCVKFFGLDLIRRQKEFGIAVTRIARGVLSSLALDVVRRGGLPTWHGVWIRVRDAICFEQIRVRWYVAHENIVVGHIGGLGGILANLEIQPRRIERAEGQTLGIFTYVTTRAVLVRACRMADLAGEFIAVQGVLHYFAIGLDRLVAFEASCLRFVIHIDAGLTVAVK